MPKLTKENIQKASKKERTKERIYRKVEKRQNCPREMKTKTRVKENALCENFLMLSSSFPTFLYKRDMDERGS